MQVVLKVTALVCTHYSKPALGVLECTVYKAKHLRVYRNASFPKIEISSAWQIGAQCCVGKRSVMSKIR